MTTEPKKWTKAEPGELNSQEMAPANSGLRAVFEAIPDLLIWFNQDGSVIETKAGATRDLLFQTQKLFGRRAQDISVPAIRDRFLAAIAQVQQTQRVVNVEYTLNVEGQECSYEARLAPVFEHQVVAIIRSITERKRAEEELFLSQQMLRTILDTIPQRIFWKDRSSVYVGCNKPLARDCGYSDPNEIIGKTDFETDAKDLAELYRADDRRIIESNEARLNYEEPQFKANGERRWLMTSKVPLHDKDGRVIGILGTYDDITERKRLEEQFRQAQKMEAFGQLAGGVAHDFNNLLMVIIGCMSMVRSGRLTPEEETTAIKETLHAGERAAKLTQQLLTFSRREPLQRVGLDLNEVVANTTKLLQRLIGEHIMLEAHYAPGRAPVLADPGMMEQVLINLAVNSRDAMPKGGGRITVQTTALTITESELTTPSKRRPGRYIRLSTTDTGAGIAPEHLDYIFEPFFTTKEVGRGTGLGLATVFGIVQQHDGWIEVESQVNVGTTFHVFLPYLVGAVEALVVTDLVPKTRNGNETILLVEDEEPVRKFMKIALEAHGYRVHAAESGVAALKIWDEVRHDVSLLVSDMVMPGGVSGRELSDRLRADKPSLRVLHCSGYSREMMGGGVGPDDEVLILKKPFDMPVFLTSVRDRLDAT